MFNFIFFFVLLFDDDYGDVFIWEVDGDEIFDIDIDDVFVDSVEVDCVVFMEDVDDIDDLC